MYAGWFQNRYIKINNRKFDFKELKNTKIDMEINGDYRLSFDYPLQVESDLGYFQGGNIIEMPSMYDSNVTEKFVVGTAEIRLDGTKTVHVEAPHIVLELRRSIVVSVDEMIGQTLDYIVSELWDAARYYGGGPIATYGLSFNVDNDIGSERIDFEKHENVSFWDCIKDVIETLGFGEIEVTGTTGKLVRQIDGGRYADMKLGVNCTDITNNKDYSSIVTRAFVFGKDGLSLTSVQSNPYVQSGNVSEYGVREASYEFSEISDGATLLSRASWLFDASNPERVDVPAESVSVNAVNVMYAEDGSVFYKLGGIVPVHGAHVDNNQLRIVSMSFSPFEPQNLSLTLGRIKTDMWQYLKRVSSSGKTTTKIVKTQLRSSETYSEIETVTKETVLAAEVIEATTAFSENLFTDYLETNILNFKCIPNLKLEDGKPVWDTDETETHYYTCSNTSSLRGFIQEEGIHHYFKEQQLVVAEDYTKLSGSEITPFRVNGKQLYYTSVLGGEHPYEFFTYTSPEEKYDDITSENAEMFKVYVRAHRAEFIKAQFEFQTIASEVYGQTYDVRLLFGTGLNDGTDKGKAIVKKDSDGFYFSYTSRTDGVNRGVYIDDTNTYIMQGSNRRVPAFAAHVVSELPQDYIRDQFYVVTGEE